MAKAKAPDRQRAKTREHAEIVVKYDLFVLPTAFHKAGLAGLLMLIESLAARRIVGKEEAKYTVTATTVEIEFTEKLVQQLMDDLYDARVVEVKVRSKWAGADIKREELIEEEEKGKKVKRKQFVYDQVQPKGAFFDNVFDGEKEVWRKLWRDMLWNIPRARPTTRIPYNQRSEQKTCGEGPSAWVDLLKVQSAKTKGGMHTIDISSALLPGAQALNAEGVPFAGRAEHNLLLHFWPLAVSLFVPQLVDSDGSTDFVGYTLAVPEVSDIEQFVQDYPILLEGLSKDVRGYRPAEAVIDLAAESALAFMDHLAIVASHRLESGQLRHSIGGVEYLHLVKAGNNVKTMAAGRVAPSQQLLDGYRQIVGRNDGSTRFRNALFRRGLLLALLNDMPWYSALDKTLAMYDAELFIRQHRNSSKTEEKRVPQFANDAANKFRHESRLFTQALERMKTMPSTERPTSPLPIIINRVVRSYLLTRTKEKSGIDPEKSKTADGEIDYKAIPSEFNETKQKLARSLFLEFRSRKDQAFVDHFAATFFSVTQRFADADRLELAGALVDHDGGRREDLKTLTLLSLSANS